MTGFTFPGHRPFQVTALETRFVLNYKTFLGDGRGSERVVVVWERLAMVKLKRTDKSSEL